MSQVKPSLRDKLRELASGERKWPLFLFGDTGAGKTSAALALADFCELAFYDELDTLCDSVMNHTIDWDLIGWADLAILDEIGVRTKATDLHYTTVKSFWERRKRREQRTIYISNIQPQGIADVFDDRIASRLLCGTVVELTGDDRRKETR